MDSDTGLEESLWQLRLEPRDSPYPERPGEPDCGYYMRTGTCGFGERCRFNHPRDHTQVAGGGGSGGVEYPERAGQPACQYFLKTGTCKYGASCKYDHPRQGGTAGPVSLNYYGYPLRVGEKDCSYYVRTGRCKFGSTCKFHHPEPAGALFPSPAPAFYPTVQAPTMASWQVARPAVLPAPFMQSPYGSMVLTPSVVPIPGWNPYAPTVSPALSPGGQHSVQTGSLFGSSNQLSPSAPAFPGPYTTISSAGPSSSSQKEQTFPERPGQQDCDYFMRTGDCKFGPTCKYHHPPEWGTPRTDCVLSPVGLPLRPGAQPCAFYAQHGVCKFGPTCKFDHPMEILSYSPSAASLADMPVAPYAVGFSVATLAPSSSSSELRPDFIFNQDSFSARIPSTESMPIGLIGSMFSESGFATHSPIQFSGQLSTPSGSSSMGQGEPRHGHALIVNVREYEFTKVFQGLTEKANRRLPLGFVLVLCRSYSQVLPWR